MLVVKDFGPNFESYYGLVSANIVCRDPDIDTVRVEQLRFDNKIITPLSLVEFFGPRAGVACGCPQVQVNATGRTEGPHEMVGIGSIHHLDGELWYHTGIGAVCPAVGESRTVGRNDLGRAGFRCRHGINSVDQLPGREGNCV